MSQQCWAAVAPPENDSSKTIDNLQQEALEAYGREDFQAAVDIISNILEIREADPVWLEARAQVLIDGKNFKQALADYNLALKNTSPTDTGAVARLTAGRALAYEGFSDWERALEDYDKSLDLAA